MTQILVTGATGFLGRHVVAELLDAGRTPVRVLCRGTHPWGTEPRIEVLTGDIRDPDAVRKAVDGTGVVLHLAGIVRRGPDPANLLEQVLVGGTRHVCEAALASPGTRVVLASSSGTFSVGREPVVFDESAPYAESVAARWPYYLAKIEQEKLALGYAQRDGLDAVVLNPSILLGPGDIHRSSTNDVRVFLEGKIPNVPSGGLNFVDVRDVARAFVAAIDKGQGGQRYLVGGHNMSIRDFFQLLERVSGVRGPRLVLPEWLARTGAALMRRAARFTGSEFPIDDASVEMSYRFWYCDSTRARETLGFEARPAEDTIRDTIAFIRSEGK
jgi:nucleoside-diphosphate-sugar epimerase